MGGSASWSSPRLIEGNASRLAVDPHNPLECGEDGSHREDDQHDPEHEPVPRKAEEEPFGSIDWRADHDKEGFAWLGIPIDGTTREAIERALQKRQKLGRVGNGPLFASPTDPDKGITPDRAVRWFRKAEALQADDIPTLEPMPATRVFHGYRAKWATETKHLPGKDRAEVGGRKSEETIRRIYDKVDRQTMLRVVTERGKLHEVGS